MCVKHGGYKGKRCAIIGCPSRAIDKSGKCMKHGGYQKCKRLRCPECIDEVVSRVGNPYYNGMCASCYKHKLFRLPLRFM
jgi:hypothetical protein